MTDYHDTLRDVFTVGPDKPLGYVLRGTIKLLGQAEDDLVAELAEMGLKTLLLGEKECLPYTGALYTWDETALSMLLQENAQLLQTTGWPLEPEAFVRRCASQWPAEKTKLFDVIADAYGNKNDPRRSDIEIPADTGDPFLNRLRRGNNPFVPHPPLP